MSTDTEKIQQIINAIAKSTLRIDTMEARHSDALDFHAVAVWSLQDALAAAYWAGAAAAHKVKP